MGPEIGWLQSEAAGIGLNELAPPPTNSRPAQIPEAASQAFTAFTGRAWCPRTMAIVLPWPSWSVLDPD
jgi:hypothetical protein